MAHIGGANDDEANPDGGAELESEILDEGWEEVAPAAHPTARSAIPQIQDSMPPDEVTQLGDFSQLARIMDLDAVPRRARVEMVSVPLPTAAPHVLSRIDGKTTIRTILLECGLSEDEGLRVLLRLVECGMIAL